MDKKRVLVLCTGNSARSQMAEGFLWHMEGNKLEVFSAEGVPPNNLMRKEGVEPSRVAPYAPEAYAYAGSATSAILTF